MTEKFYKIPKELAARKDLQPSDKIVFSVIQDHIGKNSKCWPGIRTLARETGLSTVTIIESIRRLESARFLVIERRGNGKSNYYHISKSVKETLPVKKLKRLRNFTGGAKETLPEAIKKLYPNQTDPVNQTQRERARFVIPTEKEVTEYAKSIEFALDGNTFVDYYAVRGWKLKGGQPMKDWKAGVRNWKNRRRERRNGENRSHRKDNEFEIPAEYAGAAIEA